MLRLYAFDSKYTSALTHLNDVLGQQQILNTMSFHYSYNQDEFRVLSNSVLRHDLFINKIGEDFNGELLKLNDEFKIDYLSEIILIKNINLQKILKIYDTILQRPSLENLVVNFLQHCQRAGFDLISTSKLDWKYGD